MIQVATLLRRMARPQAVTMICLGLYVSGCDSAERVGPGTAHGPELSLATGDATSLPVSHLSVGSGKPYRIAAGFAAGMAYYIDRPYTIRAAPAAVQKAVYIQTANDDKDAAPGSTDFLSFDLGTTATVYVGHDNRLPRPAWLTAGFQDTGLDLPTSDPTTTFSLFARTFPAGRVTLGSNVTAPASRSMYIVLIQPTATLSNITVGSAKPYRVTTGLATGTAHYIDRAYTLGAVPPALQNAMYIQTANDDKDAAPGSTDFLSFDLSMSAAVYVGHDNRLPRPAWLTAGFQDTGLDLPTSDPATTFSLFARTFPAGRVTLGSNVTAPASRSMYIVLVQPGISIAPSSAVVTAGIPFGVFGLPEEQYANTALWTGSLKHLSPDNTAIAELATARKYGVRMVISLAGGRTGYKNADGTFNLDKWKAKVDRWKTIDLTAYITDGTVVGHYLVDEPDWAGGWGGQAISQTVLEEMARYSKSIWPTMATTVRVHPGYLIGYTWNHLDFAWAQWEGPLHSPSYHMTPEQFRDQHIADARTAGLKLMFGMNVLDGGDGSSAVPGTYDLSVVGNRWQMSAAEVERVGNVLAAAPYGCGVISWRWSPDYPAYSSLSATQLAGIRNFNNRPDVQAALARVASTARNRVATTCRQ